MSNDTINEHPPCIPLATTDYSRACNLYLMAARDYGTCLGGRSVTDLLASLTDWDRDKCKRLGDRVVDDANIAQLLADEGVPTGI